MIGEVFVIVVSPSGHFWLWILFGSFASHHIFRLKKNRKSLQESHMPEMQKNNDLHFI
jgi:hypothetical protein